MIQKIYDKIFRSVSPEKEWDIWHKRTAEKISKAKVSGEIFELSDPTEIKYYQWIADEVYGAIGSIPGPILEIGGGSGALSLELSKRYDCNATILDSSSMALDYAKLVFGKHRGIFLRGDAEHIQLPSESFSFIHSIGLIEHFSDQVIQQMIEEMYRLVEKGGHVFIAVPNFFSPNLMTLWFKYGKGSERYISLKRLIELTMQAGLALKSYGHSEFTFSKNVNCFIPESIEKFLGKMGLGFLNYVICEK